MASVNDNTVLCFSVSSFMFYDWSSSPKTPKPQVRGYVIMKLLEPLQGIKMVAVMQPLSHVSFFICMFFVQMMATNFKEESKYTIWEMREMQVFWYTLYGHGLCILTFLATR